MFRLSLCALTVLLSAVMANSIHVGITLMPEFGHFNPMFAIIQEHIRKGDTVTIFAPSFFADWAQEGSYHQLDNEDQRSRMHWAIYMNYDRSAYDHTFFADLVQKRALETLGSVEEHTLKFNRNVTLHLFEYLNTHYNTPVSNALAASGLVVRSGGAPKKELPDIFITDFAAYGGSYVAEAVGRESLIMWPMTLSLPLLQNFNVPFMGTGFSFDMQFHERFANLMLYFLAFFSSWWTQYKKNDIRAMIGLPPTDHLDLYYRKPFITPSVYGLDIAQPLCPNYFPVGLLLPTLQPDEVLNEEWSNFLNGCSGKGVVYINMGSVAILPEAWAASFSEGVQALADAGFCVAWKRRFAATDKTVSAIASSKTDTSSMGTKKPVLGATQRVKTFTKLPFSPRLVLAHPSVKAFITHCGDTSVYESVAAGTPLVGIPLFADQPDVCARVVDAGVGVQLDKYALTKEAIYTAVTTVVNNEAIIRERMKYLTNTAHVQGMQERAVEVVHMLHHLGREGTQGLYCEYIEEPWYRIFDVDVYATVAVIIFILIHLTKWFMRAMCRCCCGRRANHNNAAKS